MPPGLTLDAGVDGAMPGDAIMIRRVTADESEAFADLYEHYCDAIYNQCFRLTGSWSTAEDLTAITFLEAWRRRRDFRLVYDSALPWLRGIAHNIARNSWRATRRHRAAMARIAAPLVVADFTDDVVERIAAEQQMRLFLPALRKLPARERQVIELCIAGELRADEVAVLLNVPVGTVKSRLSRGLAKLRATAASSKGNEVLR